jgi:hypothetical protein
MPTVTAPQGADGIYTREEANWLTQCGARLRNHTKTARMTREKLRARNVKKFQETSHEPQ